MQAVRSAGASGLSFEACNSISSHMTDRHAHPVSHAVPQAPGWSLLRLSALGRMGLAGGIVVLLWIATFAVIA